MNVNQKSCQLFFFLAMISYGALSQRPFAAADDQTSSDDSVKVFIDNFARAETATQMDRFLEMAGGLNKWGHNRTPTPLDKQSVIRMNRDTLYSFAVVDISKGATLTLPDPGDRYMSMMVVNEDHYINRVFHKGGTYELTVKEFDTPYVVLAGRTLANPADSNDVKAANALQDKSSPANVRRSGRPPKTKSVGDG